MKNLVSTLGVHKQGLQNVLSRAFKRRLTYVLLLIILLTFFWFYTTESIPSAVTLEEFVNKPQEGSVTINTQAHHSQLVGPTVRDFTDGRRVDQDDPILVDYVKAHLLTPPSVRPYNLTSKLKNTSQLGQNLVALALLQNKRGGFFIECGALDGEYLSNSLLLEKDFGWTGLLIEANPKLALPLRLKNRKAWTSNACLSTKPYQEKMNFYLDRASGLNSLLNSSASMQKVYGFAPKAEDAVQVLCIPLYTYLLALGINTVDYLSLDVEGADFAVLKTIPFDKVVFGVIEVEVQWVAEGKEAIRAFLEDKGYIFVKEIWPDYIFRHPSVIEPVTSN